MTKTVLFVTYGGGHATMVMQVILALQKYSDIRIEVLALTLGGPYFKRQGYPYMGFKDFILPSDHDALAWGKKLSAQFHQPETGIEEEEAIAYLGLSYWDLVERLGEADASRLWEEKKRNAFFPISVLERVLDRIKPDMVVTTNSPRAEYAAQVAANQRGIPTMSMVDLFGLFNFYKIEADYVTVISQLVIDNMKKTTGIREGQKFLITGNPAFDLAFDYRGPINYAWRQQHFPAIPKDAKILLWIDDTAYLCQDNVSWHYYTDQEIIDNLDQLAEAARVNNGYLLIRPHPSKERDCYYRWMEERKAPHVFFAGDLPLYPLLNAADTVAFYSSTAGNEAMFVGRPVIQLDYFDAVNTVLLGEWGVAKWLKTPEPLPKMVRQCFYEAIPADMQARIDAFFPKEKAGPQIAEAIKKIVFSENVDAIVF